jgi:hypothetical protein
MLNHSISFLRRDRTAYYATNEGVEAKHPATKRLLNNAKAGESERNTLVLSEAEREINFEENSNLNENDPSEKENPEHLEVLFEPNCAKWVGEMQY